MRSMSEQKVPTTLYTPAEGWDEYVEKAFGGERVKPFHPLTIGPPLVFQEIGLSQHDVVFFYGQWKQDHVSQGEIIKHPEADKTVFKALPKELADPIAIFDSASPHLDENITAITVFTDIPVGKDLIMVAIHLNQEHNNIEIHEVKSAYKNKSKMIKHLIKKEHTRYIDEERVGKLYSIAKGKDPKREGVQFPQWNKLVNSHNHKVILKSELVKKYPEAFGSSSHISDAKEENGKTISDLPKMPDLSKQGSGFSM